MTQPTHTAITLGPLVTTIMKARSTKAVWAASYLFSRIMKELLDAAPAHCEILLPYHSDAKHDDLRAGLYPDQSVIKGDCLADLQTAKANILNRLTDQIHADLSNRRKTQNRFPELYRDQQLKTKIGRFLKEYLQINLLSAAVSHYDKAVGEMTDLLNTTELRQMPLLHAEPDYLLMVFEEVFYNFLVKEKYFDARHDYFPS
ncbi:MAG: type III-B CRISPR-associated protein Cas10/Cmr2, partial [Cyclobacteriaceae bacterium]